MDRPDMMRRCLVLAEEGRGRVGTGARVAAVLARKQEIVAEGIHRAFGKFHAERDLLLGYDGEVTPDDTLYVNLEPCCPSPTKKTPPCTDIIVERGVRRLVYGLWDPDTRVSGRGIEILRAAGVQVEGPLLPDECARYNRGFVSMRTAGRPWIALKDVTGDHADDDALPLQTGDGAERAFMRMEHDAVIIDARTALDRNALLRAGNADRPSVFQPRRIILDPLGEVPADSPVLADEARTILVTPETARGRDRGVRVFEAARGARTDLMVLLRQLATPDGDWHGLTSLLIEGDAALLEQFRDAGLADEELCLV